VQQADTAVYAAEYLSVMTEHRQNHSRSPRTWTVAAVNDVLPVGQATLSGHLSTARETSVSMSVP